MPADTRYSIRDLARLADVTSRTIRYYIAQGLLASPDTLGPNARYTDGHLARLRLIRHLQREHLPLAEIRSRLAGMTDGDVANLLEGGTPSELTRAASDSAADYIRRVLRSARTGPQHGQSVVSAPPPPTVLPRTPVPAPSPSPALLAEAPAPAAEGVAALPEPTLAPDTPGKPAEPDRSTWERLAVTPDVEIHIRRPLDRRTNKQVDRLVRIARDLLDDEP